MKMIYSGIKTEALGMVDCNRFILLQISSSLIMAALWNRQAIIFLPCDFYLLSSCFPRLISAVGHWMSTILPHMVWP